MPIYEYECAKCGEFEVNQRITEDPLKRCPTCRGKVKKLISSTSFHLKGSGWYQTEYGSKKGDSDKSGKDKSSGAADGASTSKSESSDKSESSSSDKSTATKDVTKEKSTSKKDTSAKAA